MDHPPGGRIRRLAECTAFVAVYAGLGVGLRLSTNAYLLLGIPLTVGFHLLVRRAPLRALWVREAPPFRLRWPALVIALALAVRPVSMLWETVLQETSWVVLAYLVSATAGAACAAYSFQNARRDTWRWLLVCVAATGAAAFVLMPFWGLGEPVRRPLLKALGVGVGEFLLYLPALFVIEEVTFRGALDAYAHRPGESHGVWSAVFVSALWGLWHYPTEGPGNPLATAGLLLLIHIPVGVCLSLGWRKSGNLLVPGIAHAFIDAVRNAIFLPVN